MTTLMEDFISINEQAALIEWVNSKDIPVLRPRNLKRFPMNSSFPNSEFILKDGPEVFYNIQTRIKAIVGVSETKGRQGKVFIHRVGCRTPEHTDTYDTTRFTVMIQNAEVGGDLVYKGNTHLIPNRGILQFDANEPHEVTQVVSGTRIVFIFEFE